MSITIRRTMYLTKYLEVLEVATEGGVPPYILRRNTNRTVPYRVGSNSFCVATLHYLLSVKLSSYNSPAKNVVLLYSRCSL